MEVETDSSWRSPGTLWTVLEETWSLTLNILKSLWDNEKTELQDWLLTFIAISVDISMLQKYRFDKNLDGNFGIPQVIIL